MSINDLIKTVLDGIQTTISSKTIVGEPIEANDKIIIPITKVSFGFGAGGQDTTSSNKSGFGGGSGGGGTIEPVAFISVGKDDVRVFSLHPKDTVWEKVLNPDTVEKIYNKFMGIDKTHKKIVENKENKSDELKFSAGEDNKDNNKE